MVSMSSPMKEGAIGAEHLGLVQARLLLTVLGVILVSVTLCLFFFGATTKLNASFCSGDVPEHVMRKLFPRWRAAHTPVHHLVKLLLLAGAEVLGLLSGQQLVEHLGGEARPEQAELLLLAENGAVQMTDAMSESKKKCRQYSVDYLKFGFIPSLPDKQSPMCLLCNKVLSNDAMKPSKLQDHLRRCHPDKTEKDLKYFQTLKDKFQKRPTLDRMFASTSQRNDDGLRASYNISLLITKSGKPHTIGDKLILPAVEEVLKTVLHKPASHIIKRIPLSNNTVERRIDELSSDIQRFLCSYLQTTHFSIQLDESTLPDNAALLLAYVRFIMNQEIYEELLFARTLITDTKGESIFHVLKDYFIEKATPLSNIISVATDGAPAMTILEYLDTKDKILKENLMKRKTDIAYLTDLFTKFNMLNLQLQGASLNLIKTKSILSAFLARVKLMKQNIGRGEFSQFPNLSQTSCQEDDVSTYVQHLNALYSDFESRFEDILTTVIPPWIIKPYGDIEETNVIIQEELTELSTNEELKVQFKNGYQQFWLQNNISVTYPEAEYLPELTILDNRFSHYARIVQITDIYAFPKIDSSG
ncbi:unnamed protein product [Acanthoscelides obtectus]|uniref:Uncharacterized protein n=1 Tax=Acanthoscelides obtectus TaxID=200917 RepID=A0A9P0LMB6_ACAOB|nr:unnamed protein product [Acanthoscelides obtectus]CAK1637563.1 Protein ZBED8 [Acanthoscelides obtectus]